MCPASQGSPAAVLYAAVRSLCACAAVASAAWNTPPITMPGGNPKIALPGETPTSPWITVGPVFVTVDPANTAKLSAVPSETCADAVLAHRSDAPTPTIAKPAEVHFMVHLPAAMQHTPARPRSARGEPHRTVGPGEFLTKSLHAAQIVRPADPKTAAAAHGQS